MQDKIYVAKLGRTVGLNGAMKIYVDSDFPEQFKKDAVFFTQRDQKLTVQSYNQTNNSIKFQELSTIEEAKKLTNKQLFVSKEQTKEQCNLEENQFFWFDMIDCSIFENEELLGKVVDIQRLPLADYLLIETDPQLVKQDYSKQFLLPYQDTFIKSVDIPNKKITVNNAKDILEAS